MGRFYSLTNPSKCVCSEAGNDVYKWKYVDSDGKLCEDKKNITEEIQSYLPLTDYKSAIDEKGEYNGNFDEDCVYMDTTEFGNNFSDISKYVNQLVNKIREEVKSENEFSSSSKAREEVAKVEDKSNKEVAKVEAKGEVK